MLDLFHHYKAWCTEPQILKSRNCFESNSSYNESIFSEFVLSASFELHCFVRATPLIAVRVRCNHFFLSPRTLQSVRRHSSNVFDSHYQWLVRNTSSDTSPFETQSQLIEYGFSFMRFVDYTKRRTTVGRNPLDEEPARRKDRYLTTHSTHNRQTSMPSVEFEPTTPAGERPQTYALNSGATGTGKV